MAAPNSISVKIGWTPLILTFVVLLALKLGGAVDWSWWIITAPLWVFPAFFLTMMGVVFVGALAVLIIAVPIALIDSAFRR